MSSNVGDDVEVRKSDQEMINEFGKLNNMVLENRADQGQIKADLERLDDAGTDILMAVDGKLMVLIGEAFVEVDEDAATAHVEKKTQELKEKLAALEAADAAMTSRQAELKKVLYARFGDSINLD